MKITPRIWIMLVCVGLSILAIFSVPPKFLQEGVVVKSVGQGTELFEQGLRSGMVIYSINNVPITNHEDYTLAMQPFLELEENSTLKLDVVTDSIQIIGLFGSDVVDKITVEDIKATNIQTGLDLQGGARALVKAEVPLTDAELNDLIAVSEQRLNVFGLTDSNFFKVTTPSGEKLMGVEIAGSTPEDIEELISKQGKFEAKIGNKTVFTGGEKDITYVGTTGTDAIVTDCFPIQGGEACNFQFTIFLSEAAAEKHAEITSFLAIEGQYLNETLDLYIDDVLLNQLNIGTSLKGQTLTQIAISGSGHGSTTNDAIAAAEQEMKELQTTLKTGSLPFKLEIVKIDKISPNLGEEFTKQIVLAGLFAIIAISLIVFVRYRKIKVSLALIFVSLSEVVIILGVAAMIRWNLDLPSIAGIIGAIGTGVDSQLVILDEARDKTQKIRDRIKKALFIIVTSFTTTFVALIPLTGTLSFLGISAASAGLLRGFAVTTLIGITSGVLISRPAFADIARQMQKD